MNIAKSMDLMGYNGLLDPDRPQSVDMNLSRTRLASPEALKVGNGVEMAGRYGKIWSN